MTADLTTSEIVWNSVLSTENVKFMCVDIKNFYFCAPLEHYKYMKRPISSSKIELFTDVNIYLWVKKTLLYTAKESNSQAPQFILTYHRGCLQH